MALTQDHVNQKSKVYIIITHPFNLWLENVIKRNWKYMEPFGMHLLLIYLISCTWRQAQLQITSNFFAKNNYLCLITFAFFYYPIPGSVIKPRETICQEIKHVRNRTKQFLQGTIVSKFIDLIETKW